MAKPRRMTPEEFAEKMTAILKGNDLEAEHVDADRLMVAMLMQLGYNEGAYVFARAKKWYA